MEALPNLPDLSDDDLAALEAKLLKDFDDLRAGDHTPDAVVEMTETVDAIEAVRAEATKRVEAEADRAAKVDELTSRVEASDAPTEDPETTGDDDEASDEDSTDEDPEAAEAVEGEVELITASGRRSRSSLGAAARRSARPAIRPRNPVTITAAADLPGITTGSRLGGLADVASAMHGRARTLSDSPTRYPVASIALDLPEDQWLRGGSADADVIARYSRGVSFEAVTASGGFCGPLEPLYDLCSNFDTDGLIDIPTVGVARAGLQVPDPLVFPTNLTDVVWTWDNADDIAADPGDPLTHKPCVAVPCPSWNDVMLSAVGICVTAGNLADRSFPEMTSAYVQMVVAAQLHYINNATQVAIAAGSTAVTGTDYGGAAGSITTNLEAAAEVMRYNNRMALTQSIDVVLPAWAKGAMRGDLANRAGVVALNVSDAEIASWFSDRNLRVQWVQDTPQAAPTGAAYPATVEALVFPTGAWIKGDGGSLDLGVVRDSTLNATNDFTAAWAEQFMLVTQVCEPSVKLTIPGLAADGVTACCA